MLKLSDLTLRPDLQLGSMLVSPSRRLIEGPGGHSHLEPLIMQVFLLLLDAGGKVVARTELFDQCWGGVFVGDDSLNRTILKVRRTGAHVAPGLFEIETIPRTGYRLTGEILGLLGAQSALTGNESAVMSRRRLIAGGTAATALAGAGGLWWLDRSRSDARFDALMSRGDEAFRNGSALDESNIRSNRSPSMVRLYEEAARIRPDSSRALGLLAYFRSAMADEAPADESARLLTEAQAAIRQALDIDPSEPNARVALFMLEGRMFDWAVRDRQLRAILATDPQNILAMTELMPLLQAAGMVRESWMWNERILRASPFARAFLVVRSMKLWIMGRVRESDNVIDRVRGLWPDYVFGLMARFMVFTFTGRPQAALAMLQSAPDNFGGPEEQAMWRSALDALDTRSSSAIEATRDACLVVARKVPQQVNDVVMLLGALGQTDAAFEVTEGFLLWRGKVISTDQANGKKMDDYSRRMTQWLFTPPLAAMRSDPRFGKLCDEFGLIQYWHSRKVRPDYQVNG